VFKNRKKVTAFLKYFPYIKLMTLFLLGFLILACSDMMHEVGRKEKLHDGEQGIPPGGCLAEVMNLEDAKNITHGLGHFGDPPVTIVKCDGTPADVTGDYDSHDNGPFDNGKYVRIVENGVNIGSGAGLNLTPVRTDSSTPLSPRARVYSDGYREGECYINPVSGYFVLPQPMWWNKLESWNALDQTEINDYPDPAPSYSTVTNNSKTAAGITWMTNQALSLQAKFNNGLSIRTKCSSGTVSLSRNTTYRWGSTLQRNILPFSNSNINARSGTLSCWFRILTVGSSAGNSYYSQTNNSESSLTFISDTNNLVRVFLDQTNNNSCTVTVAVNGSASSGSVPRDGSWKHLYVVWDANGTLSGSDTVRVFINGSLVVRSDAAFPDMSSRNVIVTMYTNAETTISIKSSDVTANFNANSEVSSASVDNLKIWNHVVSEDPGWIYNSGNGIENSLHAVYSAANNYRPLLTGQGCGVGYYYLPAE
jgi:hypothetical protein